MLESRLAPGQRRPIIRAGVDGLGGEEVFAHSNTLKEGATMPRDPRKTWQYFAQAVIEENDPAKLTYLMQELYRVLKDNGEQSTRSF